MATTADVRQNLADLADPRRAEAVSRFLRIAPVGYGEGDRAIGVPVPAQRRVAARYWRDLSPAETLTRDQPVTHREGLTSIGPSEIFLAASWCTGRGRQAWKLTDTDQWTRNRSLAAPQARVRLEK